MSPRNKSKYSRSVGRKNSLAQKIHSLLAIDNGESGIIIAVAVLTGLRDKEILYLYNEEICQNGIGTCSCHKLHVYEDKRRGVVLVEINWITSSSKCYFTMLPAKLWKAFRSLPSCNEGDIKVAGKIMQTTTKVKFSDLRGIFYRVMARTTDKDYLDILSGDAEPKAALYMLLFKLDNIVAYYVKAWKNFGIVTPNI